MKGIVFTEFLEMVEEEFGFKVIDKIIVNSDLLSKGIYTAFGNYDEGELFILINALSMEVNLEKSKIMIILGEKLYKSFIENYINMEVRRIFPKSSLQQIEIDYLNEEKLIITYYVNEKISELIQGIILGYINICKDSIKVNKSDAILDGQLVYRFIMEK